MAHPSEGGFNLPDDNRTVIEARRVRDKAADDLPRLQERGELRMAAWQAAGGALQAVEAWLKDGRPGNTTLEAVDAEPVKLNKGEALPNGIEPRPHCAGASASDGGKERSQS